MTITVKMLGDVAQHAAAMANEAMEMAACMQLIVDDCAEQLAAKRAENEEIASGAADGTKSAAVEHNVAHTATAHTAGITTPPAIEPPTAPQTLLTIVELRARVTELSTPENRPKIKGLLTKFGVKKLTELAPNQYCDFMTEVESACRM